MAIRKGIKIYEPFQSSQIGHFYVLSPSADWYTELITGFNNMPGSGNLNFNHGGSGGQQNTVFEKWEIETLSEGGVTSNKNESSVVLFGQLPNNFKVLLTADAGLNSLNFACDHASALGIDLQNCQFIQMPHHGSRRNVSPSLLNRILGLILPEGSSSDRTAFVNTSKDCPEHPKKSLTNAFIRRGVRVIATNGKKIRKSWGIPPREGWGPATVLPFNNEVEE
jgi:hypothetical protein